MTRISQATSEQPVSDPRVDAALERAVELGEVGVQVAAYLNGELIVDSWIGVADEESGAPVDASTMFSVFSATKGILATAIHIQAERGLLEVEDPIAKHWPEYAANGKGDIKIRHVLEHRAGVPHMPPDLTPEGLYDWDAIMRFLEAVEPISAPGEVSAYHALSMGNILGEVIRRTDPRHRMFGEYLRDEICVPLGIDDLWVGLPPELEPRVARLTWGANPPSAPEVPWTLVRILAIPRGVAPSPDLWNSPLIHGACIPAGGAILTAREGARLFGMLANGGELDGVRLLSRDRVPAQTRLRDNPEQLDELSGQACALGVGGYWLSDTRLPPDLPKHLDPPTDTGDHTLVSNGAGGTIAWANLDTGLAVMIVHNRMLPESVPPDQHPFVAIGDAVRAVAGVAPR